MLLSNQTLLFLVFALVCSFKTWAASVGWRWWCFRPFFINVLKLSCLHGKPAACWLFNTLDVDVRKMLYKLILYRARFVVSFFFSSSFAKCSWLLWFSVRERAREKKGALNYCRMRCSSWWLSRALECWLYSCKFNQRAMWCTNTSVGARFSNRLKVFDMFEITWTASIEQKMMKIQTRFARQTHTHTSLIRSMSFFSLSRLLFTYWTDRRC